MKKSNKNIIVDGKQYDLIDIVPNDYYNLKLYPIKNPVDNVIEFSKLLYAFWISFRSFDVGHAARLEYYSKLSFKSYNELHQFFKKFDEITFKYWNLLEYEMVESKINKSTQIFMSNEQLNRNEVFIRAYFNQILDIINKRRKHKKTLQWLVELYISQMN